MFAFWRNRKACVEHKRALDAIASSSVVFSSWGPNRVGITVSGNGATRTIKVNTAHLQSILESPDSYGPRSLNGETSDSRYRESFLGTVTFTPADEGALVVTVRTLGEAVSAFGITREGLLADLDIQSRSSNSS